MAATEVNTQTQTVVTLRPPSADVRLKFFHSLGFDTQQQQQQSASPSGTPAHRPPYPGNRQAFNSMPPHPQGCYTIDENNTSWAQRIQNVNTFQEELKWDPHDEQQRYVRPRASAVTTEPSSPTSATATPMEQDNQPKKKKKSLSFHETVEVVPIPMRNEYSNRVKARLWSNAMEIQENAARNSMEFAHEG